MTASHAVVIKRSLEVVGGSALNLSYYSNLLSALVLLPLIVVAGEGPEVMKLLVGEGDGFKTIFWGSTITVCFLSLTLYLSPCADVELE